MAYSYTTYPGDGSTTIFNVTKPYLLRDHVKLLVDGVEVTFTWVDSVRVQAAVAPALDTVVWVKRDTPVDVAVVDYQDGSVLGEQDMDASVAQALYISQETKDATTALIQLQTNDKYDVQGKVLENVGDPVSAQDAVTKEYIDNQIDPKIAAAQTAQTASETAQGLSEGARDASIVAQGLSEDARDNSIVAQGLSEDARDASQSAASQMPVLVAGDAGKHLEVNATEDGYDYYDVTVSTSPPSGGNDGDFWYEYEA